MSVYTSLDHNQVSVFLSCFKLGELVSYKGIAAGIENTNYFVTTSQRECVLTLFEHHQHEEVREFIALAHHLGQAGLQVPSPLHDRQGNWLHTLAGKPAILCQRLPGEHIHQPSAEHCAAIGSALAEFHLAAQNLSQIRHDIRGFKWWQAVAPELSVSLDDDEQTLLADELDFQARHRDQWLALPHGWIHGDLFHDNVLFILGSSQVGAILDLYNACHGAWLYDLAVVANDWCCDVQGDWQENKLESLLQGYEKKRPLTESEHQYWHLVLRGAALRFWLSRLNTQKQQQSQDGELALEKDPSEFRDKLIKRRST